jgi:hypothetical protein
MPLTRLWLMILSTRTLADDLGIQWTGVGNA